MGRLSVFPFETRETRPKLNPFSFRWVITTFQPFSVKSGPNPARSHHYPTKFWPSLDGFGQISAWSRRLRTDFGLISLDPAIFRPDLEGSGQISARSRWIRPDFVPGDKLEIDPNQPETDKTRTEKSNQIFGSVSGQFFIHPPHSGRVRVGHKPDPWTPLVCTV